MRGDDEEERSSPIGGTMTGAVRRPATVSCEERVERVLDSRGYS